MNRTHWEHAGYALLMQVVVGLLFGEWWAGAALGAGFFLGREHSQAEYRITRGGPVSGLHPLAGFRFWEWNLDSKLDFLFPLVAVVMVAGVMTWL